MTSERALTLAPGKVSTADIYEADFSFRREFVRQILQREFILFEISMYIIFIVTFCYKIILFLFRIIPKDLDHRQRNRGRKMSAST
ncbi:hypothetical protein MDV011 [Gallid alphaherpesvirus 2]|nr:hypothetical protein MDV011 [Gallid alphaherpesvirus 2]